MFHFKHSCEKKMRLGFVTGMFLVTALAQAQPNYEVNVRLPVAFLHNPGSHNELANGTCCIACAETQITLCFREANHSMSDMDISSCTLGTMNFTQNGIQNRSSNIISFSSAGARTATTAYPGSYQLLFEISALHPVRNIDRGVKIFNHLIQDEFICDSINGATTTLFFSGIRVVCREGYFGPDCGCSQHPQNDSIGHSMGLIPTDGYSCEPSNSLALSTLLIAVGGAIGGLVVLLIVVVVIIIMVFTMKAKKRHSGHRGENSSSKTNNNCIDGMEMYASVNRNSKKQQEEAPSIIPYQREIYSKVENSGNREGDSTIDEHFTIKLETADNLEEPIYNTPASLKVSPHEQAAAASHNDAHYSNVKETGSAVKTFNEESDHEKSRHYATTTQPATTHFEEPQYDNAKITTRYHTPKDANSKIAINEAGYSVPKSSVSTYSKVRATSSDELSRLGTPMDSKLIDPVGYSIITKGNGYSEISHNQIEEAKYSTVNADPTYTNVNTTTIKDPEYSEIENGTKKPQIMYADLAITNTPPSAENVEIGNRDTTEVHYSHIQTK